MTPSQSLARARKCLQVWSHEQRGQDPAAIRESIFIRDEFYRGRRFHGADFTAVWFAEEDELKIHARDGACLESWDAANLAEVMDRVHIEKPLMIFEHGPDELRQAEFCEDEVAVPRTLPIPPRTSTPQTDVQPVRRAA